MSEEQYKAFKAWLEQEARHAYARGWANESKLYQEVVDKLVATKHYWPSSATRTFIGNNG